MTGDLFKQAVSLARAGRKNEARALFRQVLRANPHNETAWIWYADTLPDREERIEALQTCVRLIPEGQTARRALDLLQAQARPARPAVNEPPSQPFTILPEEVSQDDFESHAVQSAFSAEPEFISRPLQPLNEKDGPTSSSPVVDAQAFSADAADPAAASADGSQPGEGDPAPAQSSLGEEATSGEKIALIATAIVGIFLFAAVIFLLVMLVMHGL